ncbi:DNA-(apurinic or apyrimidinic site) lyase [Andreprevotia lacus DSM 23236]|jgi:formamidopyrimidine-DNA glycosylase|uniref:Formamidopyrimidine-DNA glycosylase n=1 Tax=Andreprevotia lacus DSM 23236 TaxID=1121001 RepID=A0A1W1XTX1_9NEIS|nr:bifunctional DNA-formamidopyrimidine glycosylase/DNA-(apurinic or apyrimidinic site) lyase [Andreprevotia lacus]SMC26981.1 DNA-(apurinic or apyrimidinic site) lyase [Andreprevotia lacus DSM 23236]
MPELPEVETTRRGISPHLQGACIGDVIVREARLRWPVPADLAATLRGRRIEAVERRAKYLLLRFAHGTLIIHLGMSGNLRVLTEAFPPEKHDHIDIVFDNGQRLRYRDPRRFGAVLWHAGDIAQHPLIAELGPEPLSLAFNAAYLHAALASKRIAIKLALMDNHLVVGIGNIYASESLFRAGVSPLRPAQSLNEAECTRLVAAAKETLEAALAAGGSTLRDYVDSDGKAGYFMLQSFVYGRAGEPCRVCGTPIQQMRQGQRSTFHCPTCQH